MKTKSIIYIIDDEAAIRDSLSLLLDVHGYHVSLFESGPRFLQEIDPAAPGCVLMDLQMPGMDGLQLLDAMKRAGIRLPVVMMTGFGQVSTAVQAMKAGALDFLEKPLSETALLSVLDRALSDLAASMRLADQRADAEARLAHLTPREREVFDRLALGKPNKVIALELDISPRTVELHRARVMEKLAAGSLSDLVRLALAIDQKPGGQ